jgi:glucan phosphoethanolaminetransferase (alkaline phosphatase superfamily)
MEKVGRTGGIFALFKIIPYLTYIVILLLVAIIAIWIVFGIKKYRWARTWAITLTVLVIITSLLLFTPYFIAAANGKKIPLNDYFGFKSFSSSDKEKFKDYRDRGKDKEDYDKEKEIEEKKSEKKSGLDIDIYGPSVDFVNEVVVI